MSIKKDKYYLKLANNLAQNSYGYTGPNPSVGAVLVKDDEVISFGSTHSSGRPHAEVNALKNLNKKQKKNSTIYISLEPCTHFGKSPPCVNLIIKSQIDKVVYSLNDIDERTADKSYKILKSKKIKVKKNLYKNLEKSIYKNYFLAKRKKKPYVYGKLAISKDFFSKSKKKFYITNEQSLRTVHMIRSKVNCILTTSKTINADNPRLNCRTYGLENFSPKIAIIDKNLKINTKSFLIKNAKKNKTFLFYNKKNMNKIDFLKSKNVVVIFTPILDNNLDFNFILKYLFENEILSILVEGGKTITESLIKKDFLNEFYLFISNKCLKKNGTLQMKNIKKYLSRKFNNIKFNETFLDKDNLLHYY